MATLAPFSPPPFTQLPTQLPSLGTQVPTLLPPSLGTQVPTLLPAQLAQVPAQVPTQLPTQLPSLGTQAPTRSPTASVVDSPLSFLIDKGTRGLRDAVATVPGDLLNRVRSWLSALLDALASRIRPATPPPGGPATAPPPGTFAAAMPSIVAAAGIAWAVSAVVSALTGIGGIVLVVGMGAVILSQPGRAV